MTFILYPTFSLKTLQKMKFEVENQLESFSDDASFPYKRELEKMLREISEAVLETEAESKP